MSEATVDERLAAVLAKHGASRCKCGRTIDRGDVAWNEASTEAGTPLTYIEIICQACDTAIARVSSWYPGAEDLEKVVEILEEDWT